MAPYMLRAHYDWMVDSGLRPHLLARVCESLSLSDEDILENQTEEGVIIFNLSPSAVSGGGVLITDKGVACTVRSGGKIYHVNAGWGSIMRLFDPDHGVFIEFRGQAEAPPVEDQPEPPKPTNGKPALRLVT